MDNCIISALRFEENLFYVHYYKIRHAFTIWNIPTLRSDKRNIILNVWFLIVTRQMYALPCGRITDKNGSKENNDRG